MANNYYFAVSGPISAREGSKASILISRSGSLGDGAAVIMATNSSAVAGVSSPSTSDYDLGSGNPGGSGFWLNFYGSETDKVLEIPITSDSINEGSEDFYIAISAGSDPADTVSGPTPVQVNIIDAGRNDGKPPFGLPSDNNPLGGSNDKPDIIGPGGKPPIIGPGGKPPIIGAGGLPPSGTGGKPPIIGPGGKPPVIGAGGLPPSGTGGKPPIIGPGGKPPVIGAGGLPSSGAGNAEPNTTISLTGASFEGKSVELEFDDIIAPGALNKKLFTVRVDGKKAVVESAIVEEDDFIATLTLAKEIPSTSRVTISYKDLRGNQASGVLQDINGEDISSFLNAPADSFF